VFPTQIIACCAARIDIIIYVTIEAGLECTIFDTAGVNAL
jgi:hypothetical protein